MSIPVKFWSNFCKRRNSTKIPPQENFTLLDCEWKNIVSYSTPVLLLWTGEFPWTYAQIDDNYYYVSDVQTNPTGMWEISLSMDDMATGRDAIFNTVAFVEYYQNGDASILDNRLVPITPRRSSDTSVQLDGLKGDKTYVVQAAGSNGIVSYYLLYSYQLRDFAAKLYSAEPSEIFDKWVTEYYTQSPQSLILDIKEFPCSIAPCLVTTASTVKIGVWDSGVSGQLILGSQALHSIIGLPPPHGGYPEIGQKPDIRNYAPYTEISMYLPFVGTIPIDPDKFFGEHTGIEIDYSISYTSGKVYYSLRSDTQVYGEYSGQMSAGSSLGGAALRGGGTTISNDAGIAAALLTLTSSLPIVGGLFSSMSDLTQHYLGNSGVATRGGGADTAEYAVTKGNVKITVSTVDTTYAPGAQRSTIGLPYFRQARIGDLSGYVKTRNASVTLCEFITGSLFSVNSIMDGGFYVE